MAVTGREVGAELVRGGPRQQRYPFVLTSVASWYDDPGAVGAAASRRSLHHTVPLTVRYCLESTLPYAWYVVDVLPRLRSEMRLGLMLALVAVLCLVAGLISYEKTWGQFSVGAGQSALWTICVLVFSSRRLEAGSSGRFSVLRFNAGWGGVAGVLGGSSVSGPVELAGALAGVMAPVGIWLVVDPSSERWRGPPSRLV